MNDSENKINDKTPLTVQRSLMVPSHLAGLRIDRATAVMFPEFSRSRLSDWIKCGYVQVNGHVTRPRDMAIEGTWVNINATLEPEVAYLPEAKTLDVRYEDADLLVINKPPGLVVHPGAGNHSGTLQNALLYYDANLEHVPRAGIVHRLDKDTSGLMVVARTLVAHTALVEMLALRQVHRQYEALVYGELVAGGTINKPIGRDPRDRVRMAVLENAKPAVTHYRIRERFAAHTLLQVQIETGRTHQIRVHLASVRHPIVGDLVYGALKFPRGATPDLKEKLQHFRRQALHAEQLSFIHPTSKQELTVSAPRPADFEVLLMAMREAEHGA
jgi:23S rRNA pseudouridine1911/1915/1917 synthase